MLPVVAGLLLAVAAGGRGAAGEQESPPGSRFVCTSLPLDAAGAGCPLPPVPMQGGALPPEEELKATVLQLRETVLQQKETIGSQREAIRELTGKLSRCESTDGKPWKKEMGKGKDTMGDLPRDPAQVIDQLSRTMQTLKDRLESLEHQLRANVSYAALPNDLREMLQRRLGDLERQLLSKVAELEDEKSLLHNETSAHRQKTETALNALLERVSELEKGSSAFKSPDEFKVSLPLRTNYLYGKIKKTLPELYAFTVCLWLRSSASPGIGTPFSYAVPGQANEIVLIEWGNNPIELLINDKVAQLPLFISDGKWHHICITWTTRDGMWEAFQDGEKLGTGENLAPWHPIKPGGVLILGQEQDTVGGRFDATQAFVGEMSQFNIWDRVLKAEDIMNIANCSTNMPGNIIPWVDNNVDVFGGATKWPVETSLSQRMLETKSRPKIPSGRSALAVLPGGAGTAEPHGSVSGRLGRGSGADPDLRWADCSSNPSSCQLGLPPRDSHQSRSLHQEQNVGKRPKRAKSISAAFPPPPTATSPLLQLLIAVTVNEIVVKSVDPQGLRIQSCLLVQYVLMEEDVGAGSSSASSRQAFQCCVASVIVPSDFVASSLNQVTPGTYGGISHVLPLPTCSACLLSVTVSLCPPTRQEGMKIGGGC
ncbi:Neuronal pentraxin-2 isoform X1 [Aix galericulata]|nr:Neuronal pentraxin-2 isoform X1 [Aix galericulata]